MVRVVGRGTGPAPVHHTSRADVWAGASDGRGEQRLEPCTVPSTVAGAVGRPEAARFEGVETWTCLTEACPDCWLARDDVRVTERESGADAGPSGALPADD